MAKLTPKDIWPNPVYEVARAELRAKVIVLKQTRRLSLTDEVMLVFENRETLHFQVQEILRAEGITSAAGVQGELDVYNPMMPTAEKLQATLFIEITDEALVPEVLHRLRGIEEALSLRFQADDTERTVKATFEGGRSDGQRVSAVQYVQFRFSAVERAAFLAATGASIVLAHPAAQAMVRLTAAALESLQGDLLAG